MAALHDKTKTVLKRTLTLAFLALVTVLILNRARELEWPEVLEALRGFDFSSIAIAFAIGIPAYAACAAFDLVGRRATGHHLSVPRTMLISYIGYFFSLNLGALVGGLAFRYRLYMPYKLSAMTISQVIGLSVVTNWSGYVLVAGAVLAYEPPDLPAGWGVSTALMRGTGYLLLLLAAAYVALCAIRGGTTVHWKDSRFELPTISIAAIQIGLSIVSWGSIGAVIAWLTGGELSWFSIMPVLMISAVAGVWSHIPSGLGVTELVFLALLGHLMPDSRLLAAIFVFRITYYLVPFAVAVLGYLYLEATARRAGGAGDSTRTT